MFILMRVAKLIYIINTTFLEKNFNFIRLEFFCL